MTTETITAQTAAHEIVAQMSADDRAGYDRDAWIEGVSLMLDGEWAHLAEDDVLDAIDWELGRLAAGRRLAQDASDATYGDWEDAGPVFGADGSTRTPGPGERYDAHGERILRRVCR